MWHRLDIQGTDHLKGFLFHWSFLELLRRRPGRTKKYNSVGEIQGYESNCTFALRTGTSSIFTAMPSHRWIRRICNAKVLPERVSLGNVRIQCNGDIQISLKALHAEQRIPVFCLINALKKDFRIITETL